MGRRARSARSARSRQFTPGRTACPHRLVKAAGHDAPMTVLALPQPGTSPRQVPLDVEIVVPVYNEAPHLAERITELRRFLDESFPFRALVTVVDNASTDETFARGQPSWPARHAGRGGHPPAPQGPGLRAAHRLVDAAPPPWSPTWTSTSPPRSRPCSPWWRRSSRGNATWPSAPAWPGVPTSCAAPSASSSRAPTTCCSGSPCAAGSATPSAGSRRCAASRPCSCSRWSKTTSGSSTPSSSSRPSGSDCASARCRSTGSTTPTRRVQIVRTALNDLRGVWRISHGQARRLAAACDGPSSPPSARWRPTSSCASPAWASSARLGYLFLFIAWRPIAGNFGANALALAICTLFNTAVHRELARNMHGSRHRGRFAGVAAGLFAISLALTTLGLLAAHALSGVLARRWHSSR